jgi:hypothetical protein
LGHSRQAVLEQLTRALAPVIQAATRGESEGFLEEYEALLRSLPLPSEADVHRAVKGQLLAGGPVAFDALLENVLAELYSGEPTEAARDHAESVVDQMADEGEIELTAGDVVVDPEVLCSGIVLTTRVLASEDWPPLDTDFAGFDVEPDDVEDPPSDAAAGELLAGRWSDDTVIVETCPEPALRADLVEAFRRAYDVATAEAGLPLSFRELMLQVLVGDPTLFDDPQLPLTELVAAAGLESRGGLVGDGPQAWRNLHHSRAAFRIVELAESEEQTQECVEAYGLFARVDDGDDAVSPAELRHALDLLADDEVFRIVTNQIFGDDDDPAALDAVEAFARRLSSAASKPLQKAVAGVVTAMVAERRLDPLTAAAALADAVRQVPDFLPAVDRLAWTRADQGRANEAKALWVQAFSAHPDLEAIEGAMANLGNPGSDLRRNDPCWCGSGRKFKVCHLRSNELPPLPDRFRWMLRKNVGYLERRGAPVESVIFNVAWQLCDGDDDRFADVLEDPLVFDVVLHELGWLGRFLAERGPLLPEDERRLYESWVPIRRTVYEVVEVRNGEGLTLRDVRTNDLTDVVEHTASRGATVGQLLCGRAVPDGRGHQLVGSVISVPPAHLPAFLRILDAPEPAAVAHGLLDYMAAAAAVQDLPNISVN